MCYSANIAIAFYAYYFSIDYFKFKLYYVLDAIFVVENLVFAELFGLVLLFPLKTQYSLISATILSSICIFIVNGTIVSVCSVQFHQSKLFFLNDPNNSVEICRFKIFQSDYCASNLSFYKIFELLLCPSLSLLIVLAIHFLFFKMNNQNDIVIQLNQILMKNKIQKHNQFNKRKSMHPKQNLHYYQSTENSYNNNQNYQHDIEIDTYTSTSTLSSTSSVVQPMGYNSSRKLFKYAIMYWIAWTMFLLFMFAMYSAITYKKHVLSYFWYLLGVTFCFKIILKSIAKQLDSLKMRLFDECNHDDGEEEKRLQAHLLQFGDGQRSRTCGFGFNYDVLYFVSAEILTELIISTVYYYQYIYYVMIELAYIDDIKYSARVIVYHLVSEMLQSMLRLSHFYHSKANNIANNIAQSVGQDDSTNSIINKIKNFFVLMLNDDCSFIEWKIRQSIDLSLRCVAMIISQIMRVLFFLCLGRRYFDMTQKQYYRSMYYFGILSIVDYLYFLVLFLIHYYYGCNNNNNTSSFNVFQPFLVGLTNTVFQIQMIVLGVGFAIVTRAYF